MRNDNKVLVLASATNIAASAKRLARAESTSQPQNGPVDFGSALYVFRSATGLTQVAVAIRSHLTRGYYGQLENSKRTPPPAQTVLQIAKALELSNPQTQLLRHLADKERCLLLGIPKELPRDVVVLLKLIASNAYQLSPQSMREISKFVVEETAM